MDAVEAAIGAIDAANGEDPNDVDGRPKELVHAERMTHWLLALDPSADDAQRLAARAHHLRRWLRPRGDYPEGRAGYLRWRRDARAAHAAELDELLERHGVDVAVRRAAVAIVGKEGLGVDPRVQTHEDALCLTFFELQALGAISRLGDRAGAVVAKTLAKMSPAGRKCLAEADLVAAVRAAIESDG